MTDTETLQAAVDRWGHGAQTAMAIEECGELVVALCHFERGRILLPELASEIADVGIMLEQLQIIHDCADLVAEQREHKMARLRRRLAEVAQ